MPGPPPHPAHAFSKCLAAGGSSRLRRQSTIRGGHQYTFSTASNRASHFHCTGSKTNSTSAMAPMKRNASTSANTTRRAAGSARFGDGRQTSRQPVPPQMLPSARAASPASSTIIKSIQSRLPASVFAAGVVSLGELVAEPGGQFVLFVGDGVVQLLFERTARQRWHKYRGMH